jgi:predicted metal-dependent hydrolase
VSQIPLPFGRPLRSGAPEVLVSGARTYLLHFARERRARRFILRVRPDGALRVTLPPWGSRDDARVFVRQHLEWADRERARQLSRALSPRAWTHGSAIPFRGRMVRLEVALAGFDAVVTYAERKIVVPAGTPDFRPLVERDLHVVAEDELPPRLFELAREHGLAPSRVTIRDQRSRWGSCSPRGAIGLNWRLVLMPVHVRDYVLLHELMHLREPNHSRRFWRHVERACPGFREAERWLKEHGSTLF